MAKSPRGKLAIALLGGVADAFFAWSVRHARNHARWHVRGPLSAALTGDGPFVLCILHQDVLPFFHYLMRTTSQAFRRRITMLASRSFDGELTARVLRPWGLAFARGSAEKRGAVASYRVLERALRRGNPVLLTADGPQPPPGRIRPGAVRLAREAKVPLYVCRAWAKPQVFVPGTWFRMTLPLPSCRCAVFSEGPVDLGGDLETARLRVEGALARLGEEADASLYLGRPYNHDL